jgi:hypothetical protein
MKSFKRHSFVLLLTCFVGSLLLWAYPLYVIRPFRHQGTSELSLALQVMRVRPAGAVVIALVAAVLAVLAWTRMSRFLPRLGVLLLTALTIISCTLCFVNVYELMFHPVRRPIFKEASRTGLDGNEQVIAVKLARAARAYPIRVISYHHIVNDVLAGFPIVATY